MTQEERINYISKIKSLVLMALHYGHAPLLVSIVAYDHSIAELYDANTLRDEESETFDAVVTDMLSGAHRGYISLPCRNKSTSF